VRPVFGETHEAAEWVNPLIGASTSQKLGEGKTFPGPTAPFGSVQLSPDTITGGDNAPGYSYEHTTIEGFSFTTYERSGMVWRLRESADYRHDWLSVIRPWPSPVSR